MPAIPVPTLSEDLSTDVVIIGAGFTGPSATLELAENGTGVVVLDGEAGLGFSGRGVAMSGVMGGALAQRLLGAAANDLPFPVTGFDGFRFHAFHRLGNAASQAWYGLKDRLEVRAGQGADQFKLFARQ